MLITSSLEKKKNKTQKQRQWGFRADASIPLVLLAEGDLAMTAVLTEILSAIRALGIQIAVVPSHEGNDELSALQKSYPEVIRFITAHESTSGVFDMEVMEQLTVKKLKELKTHPRVPIAASGPIQNFDPIAEAGNGFTFQKSDPWSLLIAIIRATETYRFPHDWQTLIRSVKSA